MSVMSLSPNFAEFIGFRSESELDLAEMVEKGLPMEILTLLRTKGLSFSEIAELVVSPRTLQHRRSKGLNHLTPGEADRAIRIARILAQTEQVFGEREKALEWLRTPDDQLNKRTAMSLLGTESGGRIVESMLWQVADGIYS